MSAVTTIITGILTLVPSIFKHKPHVLWYWEPPNWIQKAGPFSSRQCRKQMEALISVGMSRGQFLILRKGVEPPEYFEPSAERLEDARGK